MKLIDKDALVAEIKRRKEINKYRDTNDSLFEDEAILSFLNSLEVKEVDLEKVIEEYFKGWTDDYDNGGAACHYQYVQVQDCKAIAKRFFELGLKTQKGE